MNVARLGTKFPKLQNLRLAKTTLYELLDWEEHEEDDDLSVIIEALAKRATKKQLKACDAKDVIEAALLRKRFGDLPDQTLRALDNLPEHRPWYGRAVTALKETQPTTPDRAAKIIQDVQSAHVSELYYGKLPDVPPESLYLLEGVTEERRGKVLEQLTAAGHPLTYEKVRDTIYSPPGDDEKGAGDDDAGDDDHGDNPEPEDQTPVQ
jgi:hypothetical protein